MKNQPTRKEDNHSEINRFKEYFNEQIETPKQLVKASTLLSNDKFHEEILGEKELEETALESKIKKLSSKNVIKRAKTLYPSSKEIKQYILEESLKVIENEEYLTIRKLPEITEEQFSQLENNITNNEYINNLYNYLKTVNYNFKMTESGSSIGGLSPLTYLIEKYFLKSIEKVNEMKDKYNILKPYIYNYRTINGDGNCFYRAAIFRYLEILVLNKKINLLQRIVYDIVQSFKSEELQKRRIILNSDIKPNLTFNILFIIIRLLKKNKVEEAHQNLVKCFSTCRKFDYVMILYFRFILYKYIKENENKIYLKSFPIKIGNLLPCQYETEKGEFLFDSFYENYLLKFYTDAEKIVIYLTPFVFGIELNIAVFDLNDDELLQKFNWEGESEVKTDDVISLLNNRNHYEIIYTKKDNEKNKKYFEFFENHIQPTILTIPTKEIDDKKKDLNHLNFNNLKLTNCQPTETVIMLNKAFNNNNIKENNNNIKNNNININSNIKDNNNMNNFQNNNINNKQIQNKNLNIDKNIKYHDDNINNNKNNNNNSNNDSKKNNKNEIINNKNNNIDIERERKKVNVNNAKKNDDNRNINYINNDKQIKNNIKNNNNSNINKNRNNIGNTDIIKDNCSNNINKENLNSKTMLPKKKSNKNEINYNNITKNLNNNINNNNKDNIINNNNNDINITIIKKNKYQNYNQSTNIIINNPNNLVNQNELNAKTNVAYLKANNEVNKINKNNDNKVMKSNYNRNDLNNLNNQKSKDNNQINNGKNNEEFNPKLQIKKNNTNKNNQNEENNVKINNICSICHKNNIQTKNQMCKKCFKQKLFNYIFDHKQNIKDPIEHLFDKRKDIIEMYNSNFEQKIDKTIIINHIKRKECIFNEDCYNEKKIILPCGCNLCSHLIEFFKEFKFAKRFSCLCSKEYKRNEMLKLGILFFDNNNEISQKIINYFENRAKLNCCICNMQFNNNNNFISLKFICPELDKKSAKDFLCSFSHIVCEKCRKNNLARIFNCTVCSISHKYDIEHNK